MTTELQNLAWACLPKEFKEEVKKMWSVEGDCAIKYKSELHKRRTDLMYELFGNNLASDTEGEEMLTCERSKVQNHYNHAIQLNNDSDSAWELVGGRIMGVLKDLFGSKCLPDNVDSSRSNVDSLESNSDELNEDNFAKSGPKPPEPKLKKGDKVKYVGKEHPEYWGEVFTVDGEIFYNDYYKNMQIDSVRCEKYNLCNVPLSDLVLYTAPKEDVNLSQEAANCDKQFDNILKDNLSKDRRLNIAAMMAQALFTRVDDTPQIIADTAFGLADALIARSEKGDYDV